MLAAPPLRELEGGVEHVFSATELSAGRPFYFVYSPRFTPERAMLMDATVDEACEKGTQRRVSGSGSQFGFRKPFQVAFRQSVYSVRCVKRRQRLRAFRDRLPCGRGVWNNLGNQWWVAYQVEQAAGLGSPFPTL